MPDAVLSVVIDPSGAQSGSRVVTKSIKDIQDAAKEQGRFVQEGTNTAVDAIRQQIQALNDLRGANKHLTSEFGLAANQFKGFGKNANLSDLRNLKNGLLDLKSGASSTADEIKKFMSDTKGRPLGVISAGSLRSELVGLGKDTAATGKEIEKLTRQIDREINLAERNAKAVSSVVDDVWGRLKRMGIGFGFGMLGKSFLDAAAAAEMYRQQLRVVMKDQDAADATFNRIEKWAAINPVDTGEAIHAFVFLKAAAIKNTQEALEAVGNLSAAMNRDMVDVSRALVSTNTMQLRRLGITIERAKGQVVVSSGEASRKVKDDIDSVRQALIEVVQQNYSGGLQSMSNTWSGAMKTMRGMWELFQLDLMGSAGSGGPFDAIRLAILGIKDQWGAWIQTTDYQAFMMGLRDTLSTGLTVIMQALVGTLKLVAENFQNLVALAKAYIATNITLYFVGMAQALVGVKTALIGASMAKFLGDMGTWISLAPTAISSLSNFISWIGLATTSLGLLTAAMGAVLYLEFDAQMKRNEIQAKLTAEAYALVNEQFRNSNTDQVKAELAKVTEELAALESKAKDAYVEIMRLSSAKFMEKDGFLGGGVAGAVKVIKDADVEINKAIDGLKAREKALEAVSKERAALAHENRVTPEREHIEKGKSAAEKLVENIRDQIKYLKADAQSFLPVLDQWGTKLKPLSKDWKAIKDLQEEIKGLVPKNLLQGLDDALRNPGANLQDLLVKFTKLRNETQKYATDGLLTEEFKKYDDAVKRIGDSIKKVYDSKWSNTAWEFGQGLLKSQDYVRALQVELQRLLETGRYGTEEWKSRFAELQGLKGDEVKKQLESLSKQFESGKLRSVEYEAALVELMDRYKEFPLAVQLSIDALQRFKEQSEITAVSTERQLQHALKETNKKFLELEGEGILGVIDGFLQASISGGDFGQALKKLGQDILFTTLKMIFLQQITKMFGFASGGVPSMAGPPPAHGIFAAKGMVMQSGSKANQFASGGIVSSPTMFPMKNGVGIMGEELGQSEGIFPLSRMRNGDLGIQARIGGGSAAPSVTVNVVNQTSTPVTAKQENVQWDAKAESFVVNVVLKDIATRGPIYGTMKEA